MFHPITREINERREGDGGTHCLPDNALYHMEFAQVHNEENDALSTFSRLNEDSKTKFVRLSLPSLSHVVSSNHRH